MIEIIHTRHNELVDPLVHVWGWEIPVYLFLGGFVAGLMMIAGYFLYRGRDRNADCVCFVLPSLGVILLSLGMFALFLDLEHKRFVWRLYTTFMPLSPMSWGAWILLLVYPALFATMLLRVPAPLGERWPSLAAWSAGFNARAGAARRVGVVNMALGFLLGTYTGVLLSSLGARPLWNTPLLGLLFVASGLSGAAAFVHMVARNREEREMMARADNGFIAAELVLLGAMFIWMLSSSEIQQRAAVLLLGGAFASTFWVFVVLLGLVIPLIYQSMAVRHRVPHSLLMPVLVIVGGLVLRFVIVEAGQISHWAMSITP
jgi:protein NrfD